MSYIASLIVSAAANVIGHFVSKWLSGHKSGD
jgi:hypothetical protein